MSQPKQPQRKPGVARKDPKTTISSKKYTGMNPGYVDDSQMDDLKAFSGAKATRDDPAYHIILDKCGKGSMESHGVTIPTITPRPNTTHEDFKEWSRGPKTENQG